jgi:hypothetical protein
MSSPYRTNARTPRKLTPGQLAILGFIADRTLHYDGWYQPCEGAELRTAYALQRRGLVEVVNGARRNWIAVRITDRGRDVLGGKP